MLASTVSAAEAAHFLMIGLGPIRSWADFLSDNIRGRQDINGKTLLPGCELHDGRRYRPRYTVSDIRRFVAEVRKDFPEKYQILAVTLDIDPKKTWFVSRFDKYGVPIATTCSH